MPLNTSVIERPEPSRPSAGLPVSYDPAALPLLTGRLPALLDDFLHLLARMPQTSMTKTEITGVRDPEEDTAQVVVRQWVALSRSKRMGYLAEIGQATEGWREGLSAAPTPFDPQQLLILAREVAAGGTDSHLRSAINRAYDALFLTAREKAPLSGSETAHGRIVAAVKAKLGPSAGGSRLFSHAKRCRV